MGVITEADLALWRLVAGGSVVLAVMAVGILDYLTLVRVFGAARSSEQDRPCRRRLNISRH